MQLSSTDLTTWAASAAGDVVVGAGVMTLTSATARGIYAIGRSYMYASGEIEVSWDCNNDGGGGADATGAVFCYQDIRNHYKLVLEDSDGAGTAETLKLYKVVAGTATQLGSTATVTTRYAKGTRVYAKIQFSRETGQMWVYLKDNTGGSSGLYPTTPDIADAFSTQFSYGKAGNFATVTTAGAGNLNVDFYPMTVRAALLVGETNVPVYESNYYFMPSGIGQFAQTGTWTFAGTTLTCSAAGDAILPFQATIGVHKFTPTLANGTDYYYFGGYRIKFAASGGNTCAVTLETAAGAAQGTGSLTVTTTAGLFGAPIIITETASSITVTVAGSTGTITSGTTTSTNAYPKFEVGTATCTFADYSFSGTRYYMKPQLRGAMMGKALIGGVETDCTYFGDDLNWDTSAEGTSTGVPLTFDTINGRITRGAGTGVWWINTDKFTEGTVDFDIQGLDNGFVGQMGVIVNSLTKSSGDFMASDANGGIAIVMTNGANNIQVFDSRTGSSLGNAAYTSIAPVNSRLRIHIDVTPTTIVVYVNGAHLMEVLVTNVPGYIGIAAHTLGGATDTIYMYNLHINALSTDSTNGVAVTLGGVAHGARYDTQEEVYLTLTNPSKYATAKMVVTAKTTDAAADDVQTYFYNTTDSSYIDSADSKNTTDLTVTTSFTDFIEDLLVRYRDRADTLKLSVRRKNYSGVAYDNQSTVFVETLALAPTTEV
jgi:hypothetical protein